MRRQAIISAGIFSRVLVYILFTNGFATDYFYPFVDSFGITTDPWSEWLEAGGRSDAFPYGFILLVGIKCIYEIEQMFTVFIPILPDAVALVSLLIVVDFLIFKVIEKRDSLRVATIFFLSPISLYVSFFYLQTDAIVGFLILLAATSLIDRKPGISGICMGIAIGCKYGVLLAMPFMLAFALANKRFRNVILVSLSFAAPIASINYLPAIWSSGFRKMVLQTSEANQIFAMGIELGNLTLFLFPAIYLMLLIWIWRSGRTNLKVLTGFVGTSLFVLSMLSTAAVGWHLWGLPILILLSNWDKLELSVAFYVLQTLIVIRDISFGNPSKFGVDLENPFLLDASFTLSAILGLMWALSNLTKLVEKSDTLRLNKRPVLISIAGNSGVGKDTLADTLGEIFGTESVTCIPGDSYHKYERGNGRWQVKTHLHPQQNRLEAWRFDVQEAIKRRPIIRTEYDHSVGRFAPMFVSKPNDFILTQGLHALDLNNSSLSDVSIYMEMDETTRMHFKLRRDTLKRGRSISSLKSEIEKRKGDYEKYVLPQKRNAELIFEQQGIKRSKESEVSVLIVKLRNLIFADMFVNQIFSFVPNINVRISAQDFLEIRFEEVYLVSNASIYSFLQTNLKSFDEIGIGLQSLKSGALGVMSAVSLILLEYKRGASNE